MDNQLGAAFPNSINGDQGSRGDASYPPLSMELGGSCEGFEVMSKTSGLGANMPTDPCITDSTSDIVQVNLSLLPAVP